MNSNPFEYEAATKLSPEQIVEYYCEDFNYSRFICSSRNVFLIGNRGSGKTMTLKYFSLPVEHAKHKADPENHSFPPNVLCIYSPCRNPLSLKQDHELLEGAMQQTINEHNLVVQMMFAIVADLDVLFDEKFDANDKFRNIVKYTMGIEIPNLTGRIFGPSGDFALAIQNVSTLVDKSLNCGENEIATENAFSFTSGIYGLVKALKTISKIQKSHFSLMIDDMQLLNEQQQKLIRSWISYRDNTDFSFKITSAKPLRQDLSTTNGGIILDGHDFTLVDLEEPFQNKNSDFGKLARRISEKRLRKIGINCNAEVFFPENPQMLKDMKKAKEETRAIALEKFPAEKTKSINDFVYKQARATYFKNRDPKANMPPYSGFETIIRLSNGVIRNFLEPCFRMYDKAKSNSDGKNIDCISPTIQTNVIKELSDKLWTFLRDGLACTTLCRADNAIHIYQLFDQLAIFYRKRLLSNISEPRATSFIISEEIDDDLQNLLCISQELQLILTYPGPAKEKGQKKTKYVPNRMLWPTRQLDPYDQHAPVSIKASDLYNAAFKNIEIPFHNTEVFEDNNIQMKLKLED